MLELFLYTIIAIIILVLSAELLIHSCNTLSKLYGLSGTFIGLTILSIGTSLPEIGTHIISSINILNGIETSGIAVGTNIGSNLVQITVIIGISALYMKIKPNNKFMKKDYLVMLGAIFLLFIMSLDSKISQAEGIILVLLYFFYLYQLGESEHFFGKIINNHRCTKSCLLKHVALIVVGLIFLLLSAHFVITNAYKISASYGIEESLLGVLLIGLGTALPELTAAIVALRRKVKGMSIGVLVGSNITNPMFALGLGAAISSYTLDNYIKFIDLPVWFFASVLVYIFIKKSKDITKPQAVSLILLYLIYAGFRLFFN